MEYKLTRTFLSRRTASWNPFPGLISLAILALFFGADRSLLSGNGYLVYEKGEYWRLFTTTLLHADLRHLSANAFFFCGLATLLYTYFGFWVFPLLSIVAGGMINAVALWYYPPEVHLVGVSGVIYFMASFWLTLYIIIERRQKLIVRVVHAIAVSLIFLFPQVFENQVSYLAHGLGFVFGVPLALLYYGLFKKKIHAKDEWTEIKKEKDEMEDIILLDSSSYHLVRPEDPSPSQHASDSSRCPQH